MESQSVELPPRLQEIIEDFQYCEGREKIELLIEYSEKMPPLPENLQNHHESMEFVEECMTQVYVSAEETDGGLRFYFDVPIESPTVRGFASILGEGLEGATPQQILSLSTDLYSRMGLEQVLSMQRLNGFSAILAHLKRIAAQRLVKPKV
jgi:cysteine desulfuration protein SufE